MRTIGSASKWNPHIHAVVSRGAWSRDGQWHPIPYVDPHQAELLFRHKVLTLLRDRELITEERIDLLLSWRHSGFSVHNHTTVYPADTEGLHKLACYFMRAPVNLSRLRFHPDSGLIVYEPKAGHDVELAELTDPLEFVARVLIHVPETNKHLVRFYGAYANRVRANCRDATAGADADPDDDSTPDRRRLRKRWAELIHRIYEVDPLTCTRCGAPMKILAFITEHAVVKKILEHRDQHPPQPRAPPTSAQLPIH